MEEKVVVTEKEKLTDAEKRKRRKELFKGIKEYIRSPVVDNDGGSGCEEGETESIGSFSSDSLELLPPKIPNDWALIESYTPSRGQSSKRKRKSTSSSRPPTNSKALTESSEEHHELGKRATTEMHCSTSSFKPPGSPLAKQQSQKKSPVSPCNQVLKAMQQDMQNPKGITHWVAPKERTVFKKQRKDKGIANSDNECRRDKNPQSDSRESSTEKRVKKPMIKKQAKEQSTVQPEALKDDSTSPRSSTLSYVERFMGLIGSTVTESPNRQVAKVVRLQSEQKSIPSYTADSNLKVAEKKKENLSSTSSPSSKIVDEEGIN